MSTDHRLSPVTLAHHEFHHLNEDALYADLKAEVESLRQRLQQVTDAAIHWRRGCARMRCSECADGDDAVEEAK